MTSEQPALTVERLHAEYGERIRVVVRSFEVHSSRGRPQPVDGDVRRDAVEPGQDARVAPERADGALRPLEDVLREVVGVGRADEAFQVVPDAVAVLPVEALDGERWRPRSHDRLVLCFS